jgi:hypothetical protein
MRKTVLIILLLVGALLGWYLISPLFLNQTVNEPLPSANLNSGENDATLERVPEVDDFSEPDLLWSGLFSGADSFHDASGSATIYELPDQSHFLRLSNFSVTNGPDLRVLLAVDGDPELAVELGKLKGNIGDQNYEIGEGIDVSAYNSVLIYCKPFRVTFGMANLE